MSEFDLIATLAGIILKYFVADFALSSAWMPRENGPYGRPGVWIHAGCPGVLNWLVLLAAFQSAWVAFVVSAAETSLHHHLDFAKKPWCGNWAIRRTTIASGF